MTDCKQEDDPVLCKCPNGTEHLFGQPCCDGTDCKCVIYYGTLPNTTIKIYKGDASITDEQMTTAVTKIQTYAENSLNNETLKTGFKGAIDSFHVKTGTQIIRNGKIVDVGCDAKRVDIGTQFVLISMGLA
jgi:hypothetical protein